LCRDERLVMITRKPDKGRRAPHQTRAFPIRASTTHRARKRPDRAVARAARSPQRRVVFFPLMVGKLSAGTNRRRSSPRRPRDLPVTRQMRAHRRRGRSCAAADHGVGPQPLPLRQTRLAQSSEPVRDLGVTA
jgi:hypothetical protein